MTEKSYASWEGTPVVYSDHAAYAYDTDKKEWFEVNRSDVFTKAYVIPNEETFNKRYGVLPPLPASAFHS